MVTSFRSSTYLLLALALSILLALTAASRASAESFASPVFFSSFGELVPNPGEDMFQPEFVALDAEGNAWVTNANTNQVQEWSPDRTLLRAFGTQGTGAGQIEASRGIAVEAATGHVYVVDAGGEAKTPRVEEFSSVGKLIREFGSRGTGNGQFNEPFGIAQDPSGHLWVSDAGNNRVQEFTSAGKFMAAYGSKGTGNGQFSSPLGIATDSAGNVYVSDSGNHRVQELSSKGVFVKQIGSAGSGPGQFAQPNGITIEPGSGDVAVVNDEVEHPRVEIFSPSGSFLGQFGRFGQETAEFFNPSGITATATGVLYVVDTTDQVVEVYTPPLETGQTGWYSLEEEAPSETTHVGVNLASGNLYVHTEDVTSEAADNYITLGRNYNSQYPYVDRTLGPRWTWDKEPNVTAVTEGSQTSVRGPSGYVLQLNSSGKGQFTSPEEFEGSLSESIENSHIYTFSAEDGSKYQLAGGAPTYTDPEGHELSFTSESSPFGIETLKKIQLRGSNPKQVLEVHYDSSAHVSETVDAEGRIRKYGFNTAKQLTSYTAPSGEKTEYGYDTNGYLNKITLPNGTVETITTTSGKVSEVAVTPAGGTASGERFTYEAPVSPTCNPASDADETVVTEFPGERQETICFNAAGRRTGPKVEAEEEESGTGTPEEIPAGTCYEDPEHHSEDCGLEEGAPEPPEDLPSADYGISDNNWLEYHAVTKEQEEKGIKPHTFFNYFENPFFAELHVTKVRQVIPWNAVVEAENNEAVPGENPGAQQHLEDIEYWLKRVKELGGGTGQPLISFSTLCPSGGEWENPLPVQPSEESTDDYPCSQPPTKAQYENAVARFLHPSAKHAILGEVHYFTAWNEPNSRITQNGEHVQPTWNNGVRAGEYWRALDDLCVRKGAAKEGECFVAAGDFLDGNMPNAYNGTKSPSTSGYTYFHEYLKGMGRPLTAYRWAWHAYEDGAVTQTYLRGRPKHWWGRFHNFEKAVDRAMGHAKYNHPNIWLSEQGVVYFLNSVAQPPWKRAAVAENIMNAYVKHGPNQLTNQSSQIVRFYYYSTRGAPVFDSGLLEAAELPTGVTARRAASTPREIFRIYKQKTN